MCALKITLRRVGRWKKPVYVVVASAKKGVPKSGKSFEKLGFYSPNSNPKYFFISFSRVAYWISRGAVLTETVGALLSRIFPKNKKKRLKIGVKVLLK